MTLKAFKRRGTRLALTRPSVCAAVGPSQPGEGRGFFHRALRPNDTRNCFAATLAGARGKAAPATGARVACVWKLPEIVGQSPVNNTSVLLDGMAEHAQRPAAPRTRWRRHRARWQRPSSGTAACSIIDLEGGRQPLVNADKTLWLVLQRRDLQLQGITGGPWKPAATAFLTP